MLRRNVLLRPHKASLKCPDFMAGEPRGLLSELRSLLAVYVQDEKVPRRVCKLHSHYYCGQGDPKPLSVTRLGTLLF